MKIQSFLWTMILPLELEFLNVFDSKKKLNQLRIPEILFDPSVLE